MRRGFTIIEMLVVMGILSIMIALTFPNLLNIYHASNVNSTLNVLVNDMKQQQNRAMSGIQGGAGGDRFGIHFDTSSYTHFSGTYSAGNTQNYTVTLPQSLQFVNPSTSLPNSEVVFASGSGEIVGFDNSKKIIYVLNTADNQQSSITFNKYGIVTQVQ